MNRRSRIAVSWLGWWGLSMLLWLLLTSTTAGSEAIVGVGAAVIAATAAGVAQAKSPIGCRPRATWFRHAWRIPPQILSDSVVVFAALWRHLTGRKAVRGSFQAIPFRHGPRDDPEAAARRALCTVGVSITPNTFVVGFDPDEDRMIVHQLVRDPRSVERLLGHP